MERMKTVRRWVELPLRKLLDRGRSVLLLGPRQTGKTTLLSLFDVDVSLNFLRPEVRMRYEREPQLLGAELAAQKTRPGRSCPLVALDEIQRVPALLDVIQDLVDRKAAQFILTGSSARKLRRGTGINLLPGRLTPMRLDPLSLGERPPRSLDDALLFGSLPALALAEEDAIREQDLQSYTALYLDEEIRAEALVRNLGSFSRFLRLAAMESGQISHFRGLAQELGIAHTTVAGYYEILEDCLIAERVEPLIASRTRKKLTKSPRYLFFDLGVRRAAAEEGLRPPVRVLGALFEQYVGLELLRGIRQAAPHARLRFWRDPDGPEVDWVVESGDRLLPIEVKWSDHPGPADARHLRTFMAEYPNAPHGYVVCRTPRAFRITPEIEAIPWQHLPGLLNKDFNDPMAPARKGE